MKNHAIIVGAGLVGSLWAVMLAKRGLKVDVYEGRGDMRKVGFVGGRSINLAMSERGWKALEKAGVADKLRDVAIPMKGRMMHSVDGQLTFQAYGTEEQAIYSVSRGGLNLELIQLADEYPNVTFHFNHRGRGVDLETNTCRFENTATGEHVTAKGDLIFGADGAFSTIRGSMQKTNRFNYSQTYLDYGYKELAIPPFEDGSFRMDPNALHIWPRGKFMLIALPNTDGTFTCTLFLPFEGEVSFEHLNTDKEIMDFFETYFADSIPLMPTMLEDFKNNPTSSLVTVRCSPWQYGHSVALMGDAAHAIVPFYGQGMNAGFEDCTVLDNLVNDLNGNWDEAIKAYSNIRAKDGHAIADLALRNFIEMRDLVADPKFLLRKKIAGHLHQKFPEFLPVYSQVSFSHIPYHKALEESFSQDALFEKILNIENVEEKWNSEEVEAIFKEWYESQALANS
ncbi:MAG: NAD(P)/FAD-dependent oxidoreductase [Saprospiraceae bacterium]